MVKKRLHIFIVIVVSIVFLIHSKVSVSESKGTNLTGYLRTAAVEKIDRTTGKRTCKIIHYLNTENGKIYQLEDTKGVLRGIKPSRRMSIRGDIVDSKVIVEDAKPLDVLPVESETSTETVGEQRALVALFNFPDLLKEPFTVEHVKDLMINNEDSTDKFIRENSYGKAWINADFIDWQTLSNSSTYYYSSDTSDTDPYFNEDLLIEDSIALLDPMVNFQEYERLFFLYVDPDTTDSMGAAWSGVGKWNLNAPEDGAFTASMCFFVPSRDEIHISEFIHELGHSLGFYHASSVASNGPYYLPKSLMEISSLYGETFGEYLDLSDTMGMNTGYFSTIWKSQASWIDSTQMQEIDTSGKYTLDQVELPSDGIKALKIPLGKDTKNNEFYYWLEYRKKNLGTFDTDFSVDADESVQIRTQATSMSTPRSSSFNLGKNSIRFQKQSKVFNGTPVQVSDLDNVIAVAAGFDHSLALKSDGTVWVWGGNSIGQLGDGTNTYKSNPVQIKNLEGIIAIAAEYAHSFALKSDGTVWTWGNNTNGQLGDGTYTSRNTPAQVKNLSGVTAIAAGDGHGLALKSDGTVWAWGRNSEGQLGDGTTTNRITPAQVNNLDNITAIAAGTLHSLVIKSDGTVWAWGYNAYGQLGDGTYTDSSTPVQVSGLSGVTDIAAAYYHTLALKSDGTVWGWGSNDYGELGNGTNISSSTPVQVKNLSGVFDIDLGYFHSIALKSDGTVWAWGTYEEGSLGNGSTADQNVPVQVSNLSGVIAISAHKYNNLAIDSDNTVWQWGIYTLDDSEHFLNVDADEQFLDPYRGIRVKFVKATGSGSESKANLKVALSSLQISPSNVINFDNVLINSSSSQSVTITNTTGGEIKMDEVSIGGTNSELFKIVTDECSNSTLQNGESGRVTISFSPDSEGDKFAILSLPNNDSIRPKATITLYGYGSTESTTTPTPTATPTPTVTQTPTATPTIIPCDDSYEPNDSESEAYGPLTSGSSYEGKICSNSDVDWYKVNITSMGAISLSLTVPASNDLDLELYDSSGTLITSSNGDTGDDESIHYDVTTTGNYYIKIYDFYGSYNQTTPYTLTYTTLTMPTPTPEPTFPPLPTPLPTSTQPPHPDNSSRIFGYVVDTAYNPIESVRLKLKNLRTGAKSIITSDADGYFEFENLDADTYTIVAKKNGYKKFRETVKLEEEESAEIKIEMRKTTKRAKGLEESHNATLPQPKSEKRR